MPGGSRPPSRDARRRRSVSRHCARPTRPSRAQWHRGRPPTRDCSSVRACRIGAGTSSSGWRPVYGGAVRLSAMLAGATRADGASARRRARRARWTAPPHRARSRVREDRRPSDGGRRNGDPMEINGIAHTFVTVSDFARARDAYAELLAFFGMKCVLDGDGFYYCVGDRTAFGLGPARPSTPASASCRIAWGCTTSASAPTRGRRRARVRPRSRGEGRAPAGGGRLGARLLLGALRGSRRHAPRGELRAGQGLLKD